jgi:radical SAM protein with 4Fe4S-binding SPASM domain
MSCKNKLTCVKFQVGFACNMACSFCLVQGQDKVNDLSLETVKRALSDPVLREQLERVVVTGGEPTMSRYLPVALEIIRQAAAVGAESTIYSNGKLLDDDVLGELKEAGLTEIRLSLYEPINWQEMRETVDAMERHGFKRFLKVTVTRGTFPNVPLLLERLPELKPDRFQIKPFNQTCIAEVDAVEEMTPDQVLELAKIMLNYRRQVSFRVDLLPLCYEFLVEEVPEEQICRCNCGKGGEGYLVINPNGDVLPCGAYAQTVGNVNTSEITLIEMWKKSDLLETIRKVEQNPPDECCNCRHLKQCQTNDCHSTTFNFYGSFAHGNPQCPILARKRFK